MLYPLLLDLGPEGRVLFYEKEGQCVYRDQEPGGPWSGPRHLSWVKPGSPWCAGLGAGGEFLLAYVTEAGLVACRWQPGSTRRENTLPLPKGQVPLFLSLPGNEEGETDLALATGDGKRWELYRGIWGREDWPRPARLLEESTPLKVVSLIPAGEFWHLFFYREEAEPLQHLWLSPRHGARGSLCLPGPLAGQNFSCLAGYQNQILLAWLEGEPPRLLLRRWLRPGWPGGGWQPTLDLGTLPGINSPALLRTDKQSLLLTWADRSGLWTRTLEPTGQPTGEPNRVDDTADWQVYRYLAGGKVLEEAAWGLGFPPRKLWTPRDLLPELAPSEAIARGTGEIAQPPPGETEWRAEISWVAAELERLERILMGHPVPRGSLAQDCRGLAARLRKLL